MAKEEKAPKVVLSKAETKSLEALGAENETVVASMGDRNAEAEANVREVENVRKALKTKAETDPVKLRELRRGKPAE